MRGMINVGVVLALCAIPLLADAERGQPVQAPRNVPLEISGASGIASVAVFMNATKIGDVTITPDGGGTTVLTFANFPKPEVLLFIEKCKDGVRIRIFSNGDVMPTDEDCDRDAVGPLFKWNCMRRLQINIGQVSRSVVGCGIPPWVKFIAPTPLIPVLLLRDDDPPPPTTTPTPPTGTTPPPPAPPPTATTPPPTTTRFTCNCTACSAPADPARHEPSLRYCTQMSGDFDVAISGSQVTISHPPPFVTLQGTRGGVLTGSGTIGSFSNVSVRGEIQGELGPAPFTFGLTQVIGENGALPGGQPFTTLLRFACR